MEFNCPNCGEKIDSHTGIEKDSMPREGDVSICITCVNIMVFTEDGVRTPTEEEQKEYDSNDYLNRVKTIIKETKIKNN